MNPCFVSVLEKDVVLRCTVSNARSLSLWFHHTFVSFYEVFCRCSKRVHHFLDPSSFYSTWLVSYSYLMRLWMASAMTKLSIFFVTNRRSGSYPISTRKSVIWLALLNYRISFEFETIFFHVLNGCDCAPL